MKYRLPIIFLIISAVNWVLFLSNSIPPDWRKLPSPVREGLHRVFFLNDSVGWALTYGTGTIIHTTDGGESWAVQAKLESEYFETIQFLDEKTGWICGDYGYIYKTSDGGRTWLDVSPYISGRITDHYRSDPIKSESPPDGWFVVYDPLHFFNALEGFVCGFRFNPAGRQPRTREGLVFETKDGGQTWARMAVDPQDYLARLEFSERLNCDHREFGHLFYLDRMTAWKFGGENTILRTTNRGCDWRPYLITRDKVWFWRGLAFTDENNGFVIGELSRESAQGVLYQTADGGDRWIRIAIDCPALHAITLSPSKIYIVGKQGTILMGERSYKKGASAILERKRSSDSEDGSLLQKRKMRGVFLKDMLN
jgi:photosystem II stability/assembly factor-like uncharacterized protein